MDGRMDGLVFGGLAVPSLSGLKSKSSNVSAACRFAKTWMNVFEGSESKHDSRYLDLGQHFYLTLR